MLEVFAEPGSLGGDLDREQREDRRWTIRLKPELVRVHPKAKRAHQGWRYLTERQAPPDLAAGEIASDAMPGRLVRELAKLGLA